MLLQKRVSEVVEALRIKHLGTGHNLLMYAASKGRADSFNSLVNIVKQRAASSSSIESLVRASNIIWETLGKGELRQQLLAKDLEGKTIIFHAAGSQKIEVFEAILNLLAAENGEGQGNKSWLAVVSKGQRSGYTIIDGKDIVVDCEEKTILHHACQTGSAVIVSRVIEEAKSLGDTFLKVFLHRPDGLGQTAVMHVLRSRGDEVSQKLEILLGLMRPDEKVVAMTQPTKSFASTALVNAVYGGPKNIEIARKRILELAPGMGNAEGDLYLNAALGVGDDSPVKIRRYGALLADAAYSGHDNMLKYVIFTLQTGTVRKKGSERLRDEKKNEIELAIKAVADDPNGRGTLFTLAIASGKTTSLYYVRNLIGEVLSDPLEVWHQLCGSRTSMDNLSLATSVSASGCDKAGVFEVVYQLLEDAAKTAYRDKEIAKQELLKLFLPKSGDPSNALDVPLVRSMSSNSVDLFQQVYTKFKHLNGGSITLKQMGDQLPTRFHFGIQGANLNSREFKISVGDISPLMLTEIIKAVQDAKRSQDATVQREEELNLARRMRSLVQVAAERGAFDLFRILAHNDERLQLESIPILLERIGDYEENIMDAVMLSVIYARNPFVASAEVSRYLEKAEVGLPIHRDGLRRLQQRIDALIQEVLSVLPRTVKGVGEAFAAHEYELVRLKSDPATQRRYDRMALKIGYIILERILEPATVRMAGAKDKPDSGKGVGMGTIDPLQHALDRGSKALDFINSPLVSDYFDLKFARSTPSWLSTDPFNHNASERYFRYNKRNHYAVPMQPEKETFPDVLMRNLQGWEQGDETGEPQSRESLSGLPHGTLLPGLQFLLAGIIGKPSSFYEVPVIRFAYELLSYIIMVVLFGSSVVIENPHHIPRTEIAFYVFVLGMLWREGLEFQQVLPKRAGPLDPSPVVRFKTPAHSITSAIMRYLFQDAWNILDTSTILVVTVAFIFRIVALNEEAPRQRHVEGAENGEMGFLHTPGLGSSVLVAQALLASTAPLLFARILSLSQIDDTLGPMTQIIWGMLSHLARFSVFFVVLIMSFALTFNVLLGGCEAGNGSYVSFAYANLSLFKAMLGDFDFEDIMGTEECGYQPFTKNAATVLLVVFLVIVAILLMNLLIAVLSTVHAEVYQDAEREFHLARAKLIQQSWRSCYQGHQPPPVNLLKPLVGLLGDLVSEVYSLIGSSRERCPISETQEWKRVMGAIHRTIFSLTMGPVAGSMLIVLWAVSVPWVAWCLLLRASQRIVKGKLPSWRGTYRRGYARPLGAAVVLSLFWAVALVPAAMLSVGYILLSVPLWGYGVFGIREWYRNRTDMSKLATRESPEGIVSELDRYPGDESRHFRVDHLVKMTAGLELEELPGLIERRERARRRRTTSIDSDDDVPDGLEQELRVWKELTEPCVDTRTTSRSAPPSTTSE